MSRNVAGCLNLHAVSAVRSVSLIPGGWWPFELRWAHNEFKDPDLYYKVSNSNFESYRSASANIFIRERERRYDTNFVFFFFVHMNIVQMHDKQRMLYSM